MSSRPLTSRQVEILSLIASGECDKAIAHRFQITPRCVRFHVSASLSRLGCQTRARAVAIALARGWISFTISEDPLSEAPCSGDSVSQGVTNHFNGPVT